MLLTLNNQATNKLFINVFGFLQSSCSLVSKEKTSPKIQWSFTSNTVRRKFKLAEICITAFEELKTLCGDLKDFQFTFCFLYVTDLLWVKLPSGNFHGYVRKKKKKTNYPWQSRR